jgi:hypothetical protein
MGGRMLVWASRAVSSYLNINPDIPPLPSNPSAIEHATVANLKEFSAELTKIASMSAKKGVRYYNENYERIGKWGCSSFQILANIFHRMDEGQG